MAPVSTEQCPSQTTHAHVSNTSESKGQRAFILKLIAIILTNSVFKLNSTERAIICLRLIAVCVFVCAFVFVCVWLEMIKREKSSLMEHDDTHDNSGECACGRLLISCYLE